MAHPEARDRDRENRGSTKALEQIPDKLCALEKEIMALDAVIPLHEVVVDPTKIAGCRPRASNLLPWGDMSRHILNYLRSENRPLNTLDIVMHVAKVGNVDFKACDRVRLTQLVRHRLAKRAASGILVSHHPSRTNEMGCWSLGEDC